MVLIKILFLSVHSVLEFQELSILTEIDSTLDEKLDIEVFSLNGAYQNPLQSGDFLRPPIQKGILYNGEGGRPDLFGVAMQSDKDNIHPELLDWCDIVYMHHNSAIPGQKDTQRWLERNWKLISEKKKKVIWRSIGQSTPEIEKLLAGYRSKGLIILRYSPYEDKIPNYAGHDAIIRFSEKEDEFGGWTGERKWVMTVAQSFMKRGEHLGYHLYDKITHGFERKVYGTENENLQEVNGGVPSYEELKDLYRQSRVFFYYGTQPAPYTMSFVEAFLTGTPIVAVGRTLRDTHLYRWPHYEIPDIISNGVNGFVSDNIEELRGYIDLLLTDDETAKRISDAGRETSIRLFSRYGRMPEWANFLKSIWKQ